MSAMDISAVEVDEMPPGWARRVATAVSRGVWAIALPFPSPMQHVFCYAVRYDEGVILVDAGWNSEASWTALEAGLSRAGISLDEVMGVVITHAHSDHVGLVDRLKATTNAWIAGHRADEALWPKNTAEQLQLCDDVEAWLLSAGIDAEELPHFRAEYMEILGRYPHSGFDVYLEDGDAVPQTGGKLRAIHTPGHTPGHLCYQDTEREIIFTGDHVLPRVTPNISERPPNVHGPLGHYFRSLEHLANAAEPALVLPGHEWQFESLAERLTRIRLHEETRLHEIRRFLAQGTQSVLEVATQLTWSRPFETFNTQARRQAVGETASCLGYLREIGLATVERGNPDRWAAADDNSAHTRQLS